MANSTAALRKELALTVTDPFSLLAEVLQRNDELRDRVYLLEHALTQAQKKDCSPAVPIRRPGARCLQPVA
jgi:hypothetical protein